MKKGIPFFLSFFLSFSLSLSLSLFTLGFFCPPIFLKCLALSQHVVVSSLPCGENTAFFFSFPIGGIHSQGILLVIPLELLELQGKSISRFLWHSQPFVVVTPRIGLPNQRTKPPERIPFRRLCCFFVRKVLSLLAGVALAAHLSTSRTPWERRGRSRDAGRASPQKCFFLSQQVHCSSSNAFNVK